MTATPSTPPDRFDPAALGELDEPGRRYFTHALSSGAPLTRAARLRLRGRIRVRWWLRFGSGSAAAQRDVRWHAQSDDVIVAAWDVPPERPQLRLSIGPDGAVRSYTVQRWRDHRSGYAPFGVDVVSEGVFGGATLPRQITAGWGHGTPEWEPFFAAEVSSV